MTHTSPSCPWPHHRPHEWAPTLYTKTRNVAPSTIPAPMLFTRPRYVAPSTIRERASSPNTLHQICYIYIHLIVALAAFKRSTAPESQHPIPIHLASRHRLCAPLNPAPSYSIPGRSIPSHSTPHRSIPYQIHSIPDRSIPTKTLHSLQHTRSLHAKPLHSTPHRSIPY